MKKIIAIFMLLTAFSVAYSTVSFETKLPLKASEIYLPVGKTGKTISVQDLSAISLKDFENLTGRKMKFMERLSFKMGQKKLKKSINTDGTFSKKKVEKFFNSAAEGGGGFHAGGFFLGFLLGAIGVVIAYVINDDKKKNRVKWAWIGFAISAVIGIILIIAASSISFGG